MMRRVWARTRRMAGAAFCVVFLAAATVVAGPTTGATSAVADDPGVEALHQIAWTTDTLTGDLAVRIELGFTTLTSCIARVAGAGAYRPYDLLLFLGRDADGGAAGAVLGGGGQVVNAGAIDFQFHTTPNLYWVAGIDGTFSALPGRQAWVFAGFGLQHLGVSHPITDHAFELRVACDQPFQVHDVGAAREAFGASHANLEGALGIRLAPSGTGSSVNANIADGVTRTTTAPTLVIARSHGGAGGGLLVHAAPDGVHPTPYQADTLRYRHTGAAGTHSIHLDHLAAPGTDLYVMILGLHDVGDMDGLDTWPGLPTF